MITNIKPMELINNSYSTIMINVSIKFFRCMTKLNGIIFSFESTINQSLVLFPIGTSDLGDDHWQHDSVRIQLVLLRHRNVELFVINDDVLRRIGYNSEARSISWRRIRLNDALIDVFLNVDGKLLCIWVAGLELVILYWLFALHVTLRRLVADLKLRNPYLLFTSSEGLLLSESIDGILNVVVHG